ncbi:GroES-like protein [Pholiota conissans]|uniref:GroES-like protein n=1 Tax=Pholiota conissans TaxID=109636 RepID=A0A9P5ZBV2_9AGAR|nr:GroES-like protein [Pholiota conissans]
MQALITAPGNTAVVANVPIPEPDSKEIRVKVRAIALNPIDALYVARPADKPGRVVGSDFAGVIDKVGSQVSKWKVGDRVAGFLQGATSGNTRPGAFAEYAILEDDLTIRIPSKVSFEEAATLPLCSLTAAQALFIRLEINAPFDSPFKFDTPSDSQAILVYSGATSIGLFAISLLQLLRTAYGRSYRVYSTASPKHHEKLLSLGVDAVFDYKSPTWVDDVRKASGGITHAFDCISEDSSTALISQTFVPAGGKIAVVRKSSWSTEGIHDGVVPIYSAVWWGLGHEIVYNGDIMPASPSWRAFSVDFYKFLSEGSQQNSGSFPIPPIPIRIIPGGLQAVVDDAFPLLGSENVIDRALTQKQNSKEWLKPISGEKLVYRLG